MLKAVNSEGILWLVRVRQVAWRSGRAPNVWKTGMIITVHKNRGEEGKTLTTGTALSLASLENNRLCLVPRIKIPRNRTRNRGERLPSAVYVLTVAL